MTTVTLSESVSDTLTNRVWKTWEHDGIKNRFLTWMELHRLAEHFLKICKEQEHDYQEFDFYTLIDSNLNYYENLAELDNNIAQPKEATEKEASNKLKDYLTEEELKKYTSQERSVIDDITTKNESLDKKLNKLNGKLKAQELQQLDTEEIKKQIKQVQNDQAAI